MLTKLEMTLEAEASLSYQMGSLFHGALMELLTEEEAALLHQSRLHPYAQHLEFSNTQAKWVVTTLNQEAADQIIYNKLMSLKEFCLKKQALKIRVLEKHLTECSDKSLISLLYASEPKKYIQLHFITPTAFKQNGRVIFYPEIRGMYISLLNKYAAAAEQTENKDEETLAELCSHTELIRYDLKSVPFHLEGVRMNAFIGKITLKLSGTRTMQNFANLLFRFGTYSGIGIKTALGMGAYQIIEEREARRDRKTDQADGRSATA